MILLQKTHLYKKTLELLNDFRKLFQENLDPNTSPEVEKLILHTVQNVANFFSNLNQESYEPLLKKCKENITSLIAISDFYSQFIKDQNLLEKYVDRLGKLTHELENFKQGQKKILILSAQIGQGHMTAAKAVKEALEYLYGFDVDVEIVDFMDFVNSTINKVTQRTYNNSTKFAPSFLKFFFDSTDKKWPLKLLNQLNYPFIYTKLMKFFDEKSPDIIVSTFPVWDYLTKEIWKKIDRNIKQVSIVTDSITIHSGWVLAENDYHIVANQDTAFCLEKKGVKHSKIKTLGFPVKLSFLEKPNKSEFLSNLELDEKKFTILFLPTAQNPKKNLQMASELASIQKNTNIIIITGRDEKIKPKMDKFASENVKVLGWVNNMPDFIKNSDIVITKAGGATVMECLAAQKPMLISSIIPGQEEGNAELIERYNLGFILEKENQGGILHAIETVRTNYDEYLTNIKKVSKPEAAINIARFLHELL